MMKGCIGLFLGLLSTQIMAAGSIDYLKVEQDIVLFSTTENKVAPSPSCMSAEKGDLWAVSLRSESGRAMYSLMVTALSKELELEIDSAGDCADLDGVERALAVNLAVVSEDGGAGSNLGTVGVYQADGVTRVGTLIQYDAATSTIHYADDEASMVPKTIDTSVGGAVTLFYSEDDCQGEVYSSSNTAKQRNKLLPQLYDYWRARTTRNYRSYRPHSQLTCYNYPDSSSMYQLKPHQHAVCGTGVCVIKED